VRPKSLNRSWQFWGSNWETRRPWFWGSIKKLMLFVSLCMVQTAHDITWPPDLPTIEYLTCAWPSLVLCTKSPTPATILIAIRRVALITNTSRDKQMWFSTWTDRGRITKTSRIRIQTTTNQWLITIKPRYWPLDFSQLYLKKINNCWFLVVKFRQSIANNCTWCSELQTFPIVLFPEKMNLNFP
jgi:hypothetical protein